uniref:Stannin n=3 Tax=Cyprinus carpio TaxID=7962 RepID=A0A9J7YA38_CYPCA
MLGFNWKTQIQPASVFSLFILVFVVNQQHYQLMGRKSSRCSRSKNQNLRELCRTASPGLFFFFLKRPVVELLIDRMSITDHSPTTGVVTVIVILIAIAALGALILGCWCYLRLQRISQSEDEESIVGEGETKEPFLLVQYSAKGPRVEHKTKLTPNGTESHT